MAVIVVCAVGGVVAWLGGRWGEMTCGRRTLGGVEGLGVGMVGSVAVVGVAWVGGGVVGHLSGVRENREWGWVECDGW